MLWCNCVSPPSLALRLDPSEGTGVGVRPVPFGASVDILGDLHPLTL